MKINNDNQIRKMRVWDDVLGEMLYSRIEQHNGSLIFRFEKHFETEEPKYMISTGLYDRNGKEVYEGDIVRHIIAKKDFYLIEWSEKQASYRVRHVKKKDEKYMIYTNGYGFIPFEVIGNIYQHPHLLGGDENARS